MPANFKIIIIGAGMAGSLLGHGLRRRGIDFMIYERDEIHSKRDGYQIRLGSPALAGFRACLDDDHFKTLMKKFAGTGGFVAEAPIVFDSSFNKVLDLTNFPAYPKTSPINRVILRDFLGHKLYEEKKMQYSKHLVKYEICEKSGRVKVHFEDGTFDECDLLIAADGSASKINKQVGLNNLVQLKKEWGFLGKSKIPLATVRAIAPSVNGRPVGCMLAHKDRTILFFAVYMPELREDGTKSDDGLASVFWGLTVPAENVPGGNGFALPDKLEFCVDQLKSWDPRFHKLLRTVSNDDILPYQARASTEPSANWRQEARDKADISRGSDRVWLLGDAVHPMLPSRAMGGNQAMRDTVDIIQGIETLHSKAQDRVLTPEDFSSAVQEYEGKMIPRAFGWVKASVGLDGDTFPDPGTWKGALILFFVARALNVVYLFATLRNMLTGWEPESDVKPDIPVEMDLSK